MSILNPCYSGPDVDTHNSYASVLMNPTDEEQGEREGGHIRRRAQIGARLREKRTGVDATRRRLEEILDVSGTGAITLNDFCETFRLVDSGDERASRQVLRVLPKHVELLLLLREQGL